MLGGSLRSGAETPSAATATTLDFRDFTRRSGLLKFVFDDAGGNTWRVGLVHQDADVQSDLNSLLGSGRYARTTALEGDDRYRMQLVTAAWEFGAPEGLIEDGVLRAYLQQSTTRQDTLDERGAAARPVSIERYFEFDQQIRGIETEPAPDADSRRAGAPAGCGHRVSRTAHRGIPRDGVETGIEDGNVTRVILGEVFPLRDFPRSRTREWGAFAEDSLRVGDWSLIAALRADRYELEPLSDALYAEDYPFANPVALTETDVTPKLALMYHHADSADVYLQYTQGFRAPPYEDANIGLDIPVFNYRAIPNPDLKSETSEGLELGVRWRGDALSLHAAAFYTDYSNFIESRVRVGTDPDSGRTLFQAQNLREATIRGIESGFEWQPDGRLRDFRIDGSLYIASGKNGETGEPLDSSARRKRCSVSPGGRRTDAAACGCRPPPPRPGTSATRVAGRCSSRPARSCSTFT
ncbi:MAG: TonB-dependent receptor [Woeseiaceae bacterium]|nr:TonB-dependent receptor [Woeseiaceae bacterium]